MTHACRCCLRCAPDKDLRTPYTHLGKTEIYADMMKESFNIHLVVGGSGSCGICSACVGRLRDASDFKLQVQRSQAELRAWLQGVSHVKEEESAVEDPAMQDGDGTSEPVSDDMLRLNMAAGDGASDEGEPLLYEELIIKPESNEDETSDEMSLEVQAVKSEVSDAASDEDCVSVCSKGSAAHARDQLAMACSVVLERLRDDAIVHSGDKPYYCEDCGKPLVHSRAPRGFVMDVTHACRCCLRCAPDKDLTTPYTHLGKTEIYADMIKESFNIHLVVGGSGSCGICSACVGRLRDASDFKLQVQRSQAELQAWLQGVSHVKVGDQPLAEEESAVEDPEMQDGDGTSEPVSDDMLRLNMAAGDGASDEGEPLLHEELIIKPESNEDETSDEMLLEERAVKAEVSDAASDEDCVSVCSEGSAARARDQLAMACSVVLERLRDDAIVHSGDKLYYCDNCGKHFRNKTILRKHIENTHLSTGSKSFACDFCSSTFQTELLVIEHEKSEHGVSNFMCAECEYTTSSKKTLETHVKSHFLDNNFNCSHCSYTSSCKSDLHKHQTLHIAGEAFECSDCDFKCSFESNLRRHQKTHKRRHQRMLTGKQLYECSHCDYKCSASSKLRRHERTHTGKKPFHCSHCDYKCSQKSNLRKHIMIHTGAKPFQCSNRDFKTSWENNFRIHKRIHTGEKPYTCSYCDYKCSHNSGLRVHERTHTGRKPFQCSHCDYKCSQNSHLKKHQMIHTGEKPYTCSYCDYKCRDRSSLRNHETTHTGRKPFQCSHCDYKCCLKSSLQRHIRIHTGEKPYKCSNCDYKCSERSSLRYHERTHTGEKPFQCSLCDYKCSQSSHLKSHQRIHTGEKPFKCKQ
ncbi:zinc finger protein 271-like [Cydia fagiglandana]|uniref:zinc finger protein 271-like n=1 Tax=Cydia fagiglandana TaxID=1458189 RepID=UPI002FEDFAF9